MSRNLKDAVVVVTGGATGIGQALACEAAERGGRLMIADLDDASQTLELLRGKGATAEWVRTDTSDYADVQRLAAATIERFGMVNVLCNNAGIAALGGLQEVDPAAAKKVLDVNVLGLFNGIHVFAPLLKKAAEDGGPAYILNTGSEHSLGVPPHVAPMSIYTASKFAALGLTETARRDLEGAGIGVSLFAPGWVLTERVRGLIASNPQIAAAVEPFAQEPGEVARKAFDGLLEGALIIPTNPASRAFAMEHARSLMAGVQVLPILDDPESHAHDGTGDRSKCPVAHF
ncbi:SDR family NAD(P)-dependent oxidoreductase [Cupriavidus consociatus]|uniref:SDR family NAD(P)-dependent oxidoreductase n=1 Tax=Cupriavidus consociatus TaxID=2821357 RepID=UPI001AE8D78A|nr:MULTISPECIES: SDR family NAD(P)-dependent oxidoreductase [unclassified Cupriavidus]MBP0623176.1 SDR family NAD(P)-dependent oxidoreductase [Cupriavidus sp. LEh25]MDK2659870.1 SDR family NAD(P)-dependent oxidoreductase [Cupriavidus sp. LEh21]